MVLLDPRAEAAVLHLRVVADLGPGADVAARPEMAVRADARPILDHRALDDAAAHAAVTPDGGVDDRGVGADDAALPDHGRALEDHAGIEDDVRRDLHPVVDVHRRGVAHRHAGAHVRLVDPDAERPLGLGELAAVVDAVERAVVVEPDGAHDPAVLAGQLHELGQVQLAVGR